MTISSLQRISSHRVYCRTSHRIAPLQLCKLRMENSFILETCEALLGAAYVLWKCSRKKKDLHPTIMWQDLCVVSRVLPLKYSETLPFSSVIKPLLFTWCQSKWFLSVRTSFRHTSYLVLNQLMCIPNAKRASNMMEEKCIHVHQKLYDMRNPDNFGPEISNN